VSSGRTAPSGPRDAPRRTAVYQLPQSSDRPPYRLLADVLRQQIGTGRLAPGDQVPPYRVLEADYGIAIGTASAAVRVLRDEGLVHTVLGRGTFVTDGPRVLPDATSAAPLTPDRPPTPTAEYADLSGRVDYLTEALDSLLSLFGQAARLGRPPAAKAT
jgi:GntR family transcriptional regulator